MNEIQLWRHQQVQLIQILFEVPLSCNVCSCEGTLGMNFW